MGSEFDPTAPLSRCRGESTAAHSALQDYYWMGGGRSLRALLLQYRQRIESGASTNVPPTGRFATLAKWSQDFDWQERIAIADRLQQEADAKVRADALRSEAQKWAERRLQVRERDWQQAERLRGLADRVLDEVPKFIKTTRKLVRGRDGEPDREIITIGLDAQTAIRSAELASKLQRLAAEMETEHSLVEETQAENIEEVRKRRWEGVAPVIAEALQLAGEVEGEGEDEGEADAE